MVERVLIIAALAVVAGCEKRSAKYCGMHPEDLANCEQLDAPPPPPVMCMTDAECTGGHCELGAHVCVECLDNTHCDNNERCDTDGAYDCRGCILDTDCTGGVCLPGGSCSTDAQVIYVGSGGVDEGECTFGAPCATLTYALTNRSTERDFIHVSGQWSESALMKNLGMQITILAAPGATLTPSGAYGLKVEGSAVTIIGLHILCDGDQDGIETAGASTLILDRTEVSGCEHDAGIDLHMGVAKISRSNIHDNGAPGIKTDAGADISVVNSWIHHNTAGISTDADAASIANSKIEFNTVADNGLIGVDCKNAFEIPNNIIAANGPLGAANLLGCTGGNSLVTADAAPIGFANSAAGDYHLSATSTAKDAATMTLGIDFDYDGELRPQGPAPDLGADEHKAP